MQCWSKNPADVHGLVVAIWTAQPSGNRVPLCKPCLDGWLDNADDDPELEPARLEWILASPSQYECPQHHWPADLCTDWPHRCQARYWPSWAPGWQICGSPLDTRGHCRLYGRLHTFRFSQDPPPLDTRLNLFSLSPRDGRRNRGADSPLTNLQHGGGLV